MTFVDPVMLIYKIHFGTPLAYSKYARAIANKALNPMVSEEIIVFGAAFLVVAAADGAVVTALALALVRVVVAAVVGAELEYAVLV